MLSHLSLRHIKSSCVSVTQGVLFHAGFSASVSSESFCLLPTITPLVLMRLKSEAQRGAELLRTM